MKIDGKTNHQLGFSSISNEWSRIFARFHWNSDVKLWIFNDFGWKSNDDHGFPLIFDENSMKGWGITLDFNQICRFSMVDRHQASRSKALIILSNTACGPGSDKKLRQLPGAPWDPGVPPGAPPWIFTEFQWKFNGMLWIFNENHGLSLIFDANPM